MLTPRQFVTVIASGLAAATIVVGIGAYLGRDNGSNDTDGSFELVEPGVFIEPPPTVEGADDPSGGQSDDVLGIEGLVDAEGQRVDLDIYRGGPVVINLWFSTCAPCERELADFAEVHDQFGESVAFVGINPFDSPEIMVDFAQERGVTYDLLRDPDQRFGTATGITGYPTTLFLNSDGEIVERTGVINAEQLATTIEDVFGVDPTARPE